MPRERWHATDEKTWRKTRAAARAMRHQPTPAEARLWAALRNTQLGSRFRRQHPIGPYIADFCCVKARLVVEVDGEVHQSSLEGDKYRDQDIATRGFRVLRFPNRHVMENLDEVLMAIQLKLQEPVPPHPQDSPTRKRP